MVLGAKRLQVLSTVIFFLIAKSETRSFLQAEKSINTQSIPSTDRLDEPLNAISMDSYVMNFDKSTSSPIFQLCNSKFVCGFKERTTSCIPVWAACGSESSVSIMTSANQHDEESLKLANCPVVYR